MNNEEKNSMKAGYKVVALASAILVVAFGLLYSGRSVSAASTLQIAGSVKLDGTAPHQKPIDMSKEPSCAAVHKDEPVSTQPVEINQKGCQYLPHVVAVDAGQHIKIMNSDQTSHNIYVQSTKNPAWNKSQPPGAAPLDVTWNNEEIGIPVKCNVHPWMHAYVVV